MTPDSGYYPSATHNASSMCSSIDLPIDSNNLSYIKYINTFATHGSATASSPSATSEAAALQMSLSSNISSILSNDEILALTTSTNAAAVTPSSLVQLSHECLIVPDECTLKKLNVFELNELIEQIENTITNLSDTLVAVSYLFKFNLL
jgi:hypothetical protein